LQNEFFGAGDFGGDSPDIGGQGQVNRAFAGGFCSNRFARRVGRVDIFAAVATLSAPSWLGSRARRSLGVADPGHLRFSSNELKVGKAIRELQRRVWGSGY
jgi:hypothetical protein